MNKKEAVKMAIQRIIEKNHKALTRLNDLKSEKNTK